MTTSSPSLRNFVTRWDNDGVSLDFDRDSWLFKEEGKAENTELITVLMRRIRKMVDDTAKQRGRPLYLHTRVLPDIQVCYNRGMDVETWEQLVAGKLC